GVADGVLGVTQVGGQVTIISGWNYYLGSDPAGIGAGQYDFQSVVSHELGHTLGLGHSADTNSVMFAALSTGQVRRDLTANDLAVLEQEEDGSPEPLMATPVVVTPSAAPAATAAAATTPVAAAPACV